MTKQKNSVQSVRSLNMSNLCYLKVHRRMYVLFDDRDKETYPRLCLSSSSEPGLFISITEEASREFIDYELSFDTLLIFFSSLCIKLGQINKPPF